MRQIVTVLTILVVTFACQLSHAAPPLPSKTYPVCVEYESADDEPLAAAVLVAAEDAWKHLVVELGYPAPYTGGGTGPAMLGMRYVVTDLQMPPGAAMAIWDSDIPSTARCDCSSHIEIERTTDPASKLVSEGAFHELVHAAQYASDCVEAPTVYESFAIAAVHEAFPSSSIVPMVIKHFQAFPEYPIDYWATDMKCSGTKPCFGYQLGSGLFPIFLAEQFGGSDSGFLPKLFERNAQDGSVTVGAPYPSCSAPNTPNWFHAVDLTLSSYGSNFKNAFLEFAVWRAITGEHDDGAHYHAGKSFAEPAIAGTIELTAGLEGETTLHEYSTRYLEIAGWEALDPGSKIVHLQVDSAAQWGGSLIVWTPGKTASALPIEFAQAGADVDLGGLSGASRVLLALSQLDDGVHVPDDMDYRDLRTAKWFVHDGAGDGGVKDASREVPDVIGSPDSESPDGSVEGGALNDASDASGDVLDAIGSMDSESPDGSVESGSAARGGCSCELTLGEPQGNPVGLGALLVAWFGLAVRAGTLRRRLVSATPSASRWWRWHGEQCRCDGRRYQDD